MTLSSERLSKNHAPQGRGSWFGQTLRGRGGFTLIELLVVIAIIGILSSIILASLSGARKRGRDARRIADIKQLQLALELYYDANQKYPTMLSAAAIVTPGYIPAIPKDPSSNNAYAYAALQGAPQVPLTCASYHLAALLEVNNVGNSGSPFFDDNDGTVGGAYGVGSGDGAVCTGGGWAGGDIPQSGATGDFNGDNDATNLVYDMRP